MLFYSMLIGRVTPRLCRLNYRMSIYRRLATGIPESIGRAASFPPRDAQDWQQVSSNHAWYIYQHNSSWSDPYGGKR